MEIRDYLLLLSIFVGIVGWLITFYLSKMKDRELEYFKWNKKYLDQQLSEFYGPIYGVLLENHRHTKDIQHQFGRTIIFEGGNNLTPEEEQTWIHYLENYFLPNNRKIIDIIKNNIHLLNGEELPDSFLKFIDYATSYEALHKRYVDYNREYGFYTKRNFPQEFRSEIVNKVSRLKKEQWKIVNNVRAFDKS